jgi:hypothetical protein
MFGIRAVADFVGAILDRQTPVPPTVEKAGNLAGITSTFYRDAERQKADHAFSLSSARRRRIASNADYLRDGGAFRPEDSRLIFC